MFKRMIAGILALGLVFCVPGLGYAAFTVRQSGAIPVAATVAESVGFGVNVNGDGTLNFTPTLTNPVAIADDSVQMVFSNNVIYGAETFKSVIISTDNRAATAVPKYTGLGTGSGLVNAGATAFAAPLYWTVWRSEAEANAYDKDLGGTPNAWPAFDVDTAVEPQKALRRADERIDSRTHFFVADKKQDQETLPDFNPGLFDPGFATVVAGVSGPEGALANAPVDATPTDPSDDYRDCKPGTPVVCDDPDTLANEGDGVFNDVDNFNAGKQRTVEQDLDGSGQADVWLRLASDFAGQPAGSYSTNTLKIELISQTP